MVNPNFLNFLPGRKYLELLKKIRAFGAQPLKRLNCFCVVIFLPRRHWPLKLGFEPAKKPDQQRDPAVVSSEPARLFAALKLR